jgi:hypothetical protein
MDNFTIAVVVGDVVVMLFFLAMLVVDKKKDKRDNPVVQMNPVKSAGKRST